MASSYPEDRSGVLASNLVTNEIQTITAENNRNFHFFIPNAAPFFRDGFKIFQNINGTLLPLVENVDYVFVYKFESASLSTMKDVFGGVGFLDLSVEGEFKLTYQTIGGDWILDADRVLEIVANEVFNPRGRTWDQVSGKPTNFGPTSHIQDASDFLSEQEVGDKLDSIAQAIAANASRAAIAAPVTLESLGIPKIGNWGMASIAQAIEGVSSDTIINPLTLNAVLVKLGLTDAAATIAKFNEHIEDLNNPHEDDPETIGLGNVDNVGVTDNQVLLANRDSDTLITLTQLKTYLRMFGCQTAPEDTPTYPVKGALLSSRCTTNYDKIGIFADGLGNTYEDILENNSTDCGYVAPQATNYPPFGTILRYYCLDYDRWKLVADGYGGSYNTFVQANSGDCGYTGGAVTSNPPAGTLLSSYCNGTVLVQTLANGTGGSYENSVPGSPDCASQAQYPARGTLVSTSCENQNEVGKYTDGTGGYYTEVITVNSTKCGYIAVTTPAPVTYAPYGTPMGTQCQGTTLVNVFANGSGGTYTSISQNNSPSCGYVATTTTAAPVTTTTTTTVPLSLTYTDSWSLLTPSSTGTRVVTVTLKGGKPNFTYYVKIYYKGSVQLNGTQLEMIGYPNGNTNYAPFTLTTNSSGTGTYSYTQINATSQNLYGFDDTFQSWAEVTESMTSGLTVAKSNTQIMTVSGFGSTGGYSMINYTTNVWYVVVGSVITYTIAVRGLPANTTFTLRTYIQHVNFQQKTVNSYSVRITTDSVGNALFYITPTIQGNPLGVTAASTIVPDGDYLTWVTLYDAANNAYESTRFYYTWKTGSTLSPSILNTYPSTTGYDIT